MAPEVLGVAACGATTSATLVGVPRNSHPEPHFEEWGYRYSTTAPNFLVRFWYVSTASSNSFSPNSGQVTLVT
jgi:hypothetical protein